MSNANANNGPKPTIFSNISFGPQIAAGAGCVVKLDDTDVSDYRGCFVADDGISDYRLGLNSNGPISSVAIEIKITGRKIQYRDGGRWMRCKVEFLQDDAPSNIYGAWVQM